MPLSEALLDLQELTRRLRRDCPWDREQTARTIVPHTVEEAYEVADAAHADDPSKLLDELGDLLFQVYFLSLLLEEQGDGDLEAVARAVHEKLVRRHPHVFGAVEADTVAEVMTNWEQIKLAEKGSASLVEGISPGLASLLYAHKLYRKAASIGLDPGSDAEALDRAALAVGALRDADAAATEERLGDLLAAAVVLARARGVDAETALRGWIARFRDRFVRMEELAAAGDVDLAAAPPDRVAALWIEAGSSPP
jgi:MazG family protein